MLLCNGIKGPFESFLPPDVECCVVEVPDALRGAKIVAAVTQPIDDKATLKKMSEHLPNIALPSKFVVIAEMPKTGSGKIDFRTITDKVRDIVQSQ